MHTLLAVILTANAHTACLTQGVLVGSGPHYGGLCGWHIVVIIILAVAVLPDFGKHPQQSMFHLILGKSTKLKTILAPTTGLTEGPHDHCPAAPLKPVPEQHHHSCWGPGLSAWRTLKSVEKWLDTEHRVIFSLVVIANLAISVQAFIFPISQLLYHIALLNRITFQPDDFIGEGGWGQYGWGWMEGWWQITTGHISPFPLLSHAYHLLIEVWLPRRDKPWGIRNDKTFCAILSSVSRKWTASFLPCSSLIKWTLCFLWVENRLGDTQGFSGQSGTLWVQLSFWF